MVSRNEQGMKGKKKWCEHCKKNGHTKEKTLAGIFMENHLSGNQKRYHAATESCSGKVEEEQQQSSMNQQAQLDRIL